MDELLEPFGKLLASVEDRSAEEQREAIDEAGYLDALRAESGLTLVEVQPLISALGYHAIETPVAEEMAARALGRDELPRPVAAVLAAAEIAGAAARVLDLSLAHAADRVQFGKPIGKQQAVQHNLAVMAEQVLMARIAAQLGCSAGLDPALELAATAKQVTSVAALQVATLGHAIHGAIGITREHRLHRFTTRLHRLRLAGGAESWWAEQLGRKALGAAEPTALGLVRAFA